MFWISNARYCKVWKIFEATDKYVDVSIGTGEKGTDGEFRNSSWPARLIGHAFNQFKKGDISEGGTYTITKGKLTNERYQTDDGEWKKALRLLVLEFDTGSDAAEEKPHAIDFSAKKLASKSSKETSKNSTPW